MAILQFRLRSTLPSGDSWVVGVYDDRATADRVKASWEAIVNSSGNVHGRQFTVERNP
jgi:hypothetical protein